MSTIDRRKIGTVAVLTIDNPPVNALNATLRANLIDAIEAARGDPDISAIVLTGAGNVFVAGADIAEFNKGMSTPYLPQVVSALSDAGKPVVAAINGAALGGGLELALAATHRIGGTAAALGLPEIQLGLIPGSGGTQRLGRMLGGAKALELIASASTLNAGQALDLGLLDRVAKSNLLDEAIAMAEKAIHHPAERRKFAPVDRDAFETLAADLLSREKGNQYKALVEALSSGYELPPTKAEAVERRLFLDLVGSPVSKALRYLFQAERDARRVPELSREAKGRHIDSAAVIGAGTMGVGITLSLLGARIPVMLIEADVAALSRGLERISQNYQTRVDRGKISPEDARQQFGLLTGRTDIESIYPVDLIIEAVYEDIEVKIDIMRSIGSKSKPGAVIATNTSYLDVDVLADETGRPQDVVGLHFFSPANVMKLLEVVRGAQTSADVVNTALKFARTIGKVAVVVGVCRGFVGNRMLTRRTEQVERLMAKGVLPHQIDAAMREFGFAMGPLAAADLAGLDIGWRSRKSNGGMAPVADALCEAGYFGQKTGAGFYLYSDGSRVPQRNPFVDDLIGRVAGSSARTSTISSEEIHYALLLPMIEEGNQILDEGIAARKSDIDLVWIHGYGFPKHRGGPMYWAEQVGEAELYRRKEALADRFGPEFFKNVRGKEQ